ncbi:MAG: FAD-dependent oxidoreductase [Planctomycetota bacterium]|nr:FAD-dependent oxidoreductase [Planctomycetota bacterium]
MPDEVTQKEAAPDPGAPRIGVFVCHCGANIAGFVDIEAIENHARALPNVAFTQRNLYTCSETGLREIKTAIAAQKLNRVVVASCSPRTHEPLFRSACREAGLNPFLFEFVNIRDQCSWVHMQQREGATRKAKELIQMGVARAALLEPQEDITVGVAGKALIIGGGISGITATMSIARRGFQVILVEREKELGGILKNVHKLYPTMGSAGDLIGKNIRAVQKMPRVQVLTSARLVEVSGFVGNYKVTIDSEGKRIEDTVGVIVVATGARLLTPEGLFQYNGRNIVTQGELELLLKQGRLDADSIVMIQCVGARVPGREYCSRVCCMTAIKNAILIREAQPETAVFVLYRDIQTYGTLYEEDYRRARELGVSFIRYNLSKPPVVSSDKVIVHDELLGEDVPIPFDLLALATPLIPQAGFDELSKALKVPVDENGFFLEAHAKLRPVDFATDGIFLCGCARWPSDIGESVSQALAAAARASIPLSQGHVKVEPIVSQVDQNRCIGCGLCETVCSYVGIHLTDTPKGKKAETIRASCKGCGTCGASCPQKAIRMSHFTDGQIEAQICALVGTDK